MASQAITSIVFLTVLCITMQMTHSSSVEEICKSVKLPPKVIITCKLIENIEALTALHYKYEQNEPETQTFIRKQICKSDELPPEVKKKCLLLEKCEAIVASYDTKEDNQENIVDSENNENITFAPFDNNEKKEEEYLDAKYENNGKEYAGMYENYENNEDKTLDAKYENNENEYAAMYENYENNEDKTLDAKYENNEKENAEMYENFENNEDKTVDNENISTAPPYDNYEKEPVAEAPIDKFNPDTKSLAIQEICKSTILPERIQKHCKNIDYIENYIAWYYNYAKEDSISHSRLRQRYCRDATLPQIIKKCEFIEISEEVVAYYVNSTNDEDLIPLDSSKQNDQMGHIYHWGPINQR